MYFIELYIINIKTKGDSYLQDYTKTDLTDGLHQIFGLDTDTEITTYKKVSNLRLYKNKLGNTSILFMIPILYKIVLEMIKW